MGIENQNFIMAYKTPIGEYKVDESMDIYLNNKKIDTKAHTVPQVRERIAELIDMHRGELVKEYQAKISEINGMSHRIETYRVKFG